MADTRDGRSEQDADARTILAALTVEKLNPAVYTCAELMNRSYASHLKMGNVNDFVVSGEYGAYLLAQAAMNGGLMGVFSELLTYQRGNEFYRTALPAAWVGKTFMDLFVELKREHNAVLVAVHTAADEMIVNPSEHIFASGDEIVVIAEHEISL
jgi:voltage-gated potassium channel